MNSLEFIDEEIKYEKENIKLWTPKEKTSKRLKYLQQIKDELEAWKIVKKHRSYSYIKHKNLFDFTVMISDDDPDCERLLKALEVKEIDNR